MNNQRTTGLVLVVIAVILFMIGSNASHSMADRLSDLFTGHFTDNTVWYLIGGVAAAITGLRMMIVAARRAAA